MNEIRIENLWALPLAVKMNPYYLRGISETSNTSAVSVCFPSTISTHTRR